MVGINFVTVSVYVLMLFLTCVVEDKLNDVLNLVKSQVVLWPLSCVPVYPHSWSIFDFFMFLNLLRPMLRRNKKVR